jgi:C-terminal processing protease CtpA/Prc
MKLSIPATVLVLFAAQPLAATLAHGQQAVTAPASGTSVSPGFNHVFASGLTRTQTGWQARDYPRVSSLTEGSAAAKAGLRTGDIIVSVNGRDAREPPLFSALRPGAGIVMRVRRGTEEREIRYRLDG